MLIKYFNIFIIIRVDSIYGYEIKQLYKNIIKLIICQDDQLLEEVANIESKN